MTHSNRNILVVEDNEDDFYLLKWACKKGDLVAEFRHVADGQQAIDYLQGASPFSDRKIYPFPQLVLLDLKLPIKHGFSVLEWIRKQFGFHGLIILMLTSSKEERDIEKAYALGANAFLVKPSSVDKMAEMMRSVDLFWFQHNVSQLITSGSSIRHHA